MKDRLSILGDAYTFLATSAETNDAYITVQAVIGPGNGPPPHVHLTQEESFYVLEGEMTFWLNGEPSRHGAGSFVRVPPGTPHTFKNESAHDVRMLFSVTPGGKMDDFFRAFGTPLQEGEAPGPPTAEEIATVMELAPKYGMQILV